MSIADFIEQLTYTPKTNIASVVEICCDILTRVIAKESAPRPVVAGLRDCHSALSSAFSDFDCLVVVKNICCQAMIMPVVAAPWNHGCLLSSPVDAAVRATLLFSAGIIRRICDGTLLIEIGENLSTELSARVSSVGNAFEEWVACMAFPMQSSRIGTITREGQFEISQQAADEAAAQCLSTARSNKRRKLNDMEDSECLITSTAVEADHDLSVPSVARSSPRSGSRFARSGGVTAPKAGNLIPIHIFAKQSIRSKAMMSFDASSSERMPQKNSHSSSDSETEQTSTNSAPHLEIVNLPAAQTYTEDAEVCDTPKFCRTAEEDEPAYKLPSFDEEPTQHCLSQATMEHPLANMWGDKTNLKTVIADTKYTVLMLVRNVGCAATRQAVSRIGAWINLLTMFKAQIVCVANGDVGKSAASFREATGFAGQIVMDTKSKDGIFNQLGCLRGWKHALFNMRSLRSIGSAVAAGFKQTSTSGDMRQLGGVIVVDQSGNVVMKHIETFVGESVVIQQVLRALGADEDEIEKWVPKEEKRSKSLPNLNGQKAPGKLARGRSTSHGLEAK